MWVTHMPLRMRGKEERRGEGGDKLTTWCTLRRVSKCGSISEFEKPQVDEAIKLLVTLYDNNPSAWTSVNDLLADDTGEGSSIGPRKFINFCNNPCQQTLTKKCNCITWFVHMVQKILHFHKEGLCVRTRLYIYNENSNKVTNWPIAFWVEIWHL